VYLEYILNFHVPVCHVFKVHTPCSGDKGARDPFYCRLKKIYIVVVNGHISTVK
jgi:hypothetical protein